MVPMIYILDKVYAHKFSGLQHLLWLRSSRGETFVVYCILLDIIIVQTLKCLNLQNNRIDIRGVQHFVSVLYVNKVKSIS
jgi:hypothetical protein